METVGRERFSGESIYKKSELSGTAVTAAKKGAVKDAVRLWKINANLDRSKLEGLTDLAQTEAKPMLHEFYLAMKKTDGLSYLPDRALKILDFTQSSAGDR